MNKTSFNDFEFLRTLGKGAFSTVYLVRRKIDKKQYALKSITMEKLKESEQQNSVNEIRILASISHQNVIGYKESFWNEKNKTLNIVMEYCDDGDLETKIKNMKRNRQRFEESLIWNYTIQIIRGLKALHDKKILHRDLKSANIFLTKENNQCKIGDLNVSKVMKEKYIAKGQIGTPSYSSPEIWQNKPYSFKSDLWSVGCIIYEMCCLRPPFKGKNFDELCDSICNGKIEKISSRYSEDLWKVIKMMLEVDVDKRVDCDMFLNHQIIKNQIEELNNIFGEDNINDDSSMLDTIEYKNLRDLENKIPNKRKYDQLVKKIKKSNDKKENIEETIKNDSSFDEFSISEKMPINNMNKNNYNYNINNNNIIFKRNKNIKSDIFKKIEKEKLFNRNLNVQKKNKSFNNLNYTNLILDDIDEYHFKKNRSQEIINNKLIVEQKIDRKFKKNNIMKYKIIENNRKQKEIKKGKKIIYEKVNLSNKIVLFPQDNKIIKSGLNILKGDIARKISQENLLISSYIKKPNEESNKVSNSNPKSLKKNNVKLKSSKNVEYNRESIIKKAFRPSLFNTNENDKKEKNQNQKINSDLSDNFIKIKSHELRKMNGLDGSSKKIKKNIITRKFNFSLNNDNNVLESKKSKEIDNKNKIIIYNHNKKGNEKNLIINTNKTERNITSGEEKIKKLTKYCDKHLNKNISGISENLNISHKNKNIKSNKCVNNYKGSSKLVEIDISNNQFYVKKSSFYESRNPFNTEQTINNNNNFLTNNTQELRTSKILSKKNIKLRLSTKNNNIKNFSNKSIKIGDI